MRADLTSNEGCRRQEARGECVGVAFDVGNARERGCVSDTRRVCKRDASAQVVEQQMTELVREGHPGVPVLFAAVPEIREDRRDRTEE